MRSWHAFTCALLVLLLSATTTFGVQSAPRHSQWSDAAYQQSLLATLDVATDGTVVIRDLGTAIHLLGPDYEAASADLAMLNTAIIHGQVPAFKTCGELAVFEPIPPVDETIGILPAASGCRGACQHGICCCRGWWIFCWGYCSC